MSSDDQVGLGDRAAPWLVAYASGAVLMLEIVSLRLVAPYVGLSLETSTAVIGFALAAIAAGAWAGGKVADRFTPQRVLGPMVLAAGALVLIVGPVVRWTAELVPSGDIVTVLLVAAVAVFPPAALLSAVTPMVVKMRLTALSQTGTVVGSMSAYATVGALVATFGTGFFLIAAVPTSFILLVLGATLLVAGAVLTIRHRVLTTSLILLVASSVLIAVTAPASPCDVETAYHCARIVVDDDRVGGRSLQLDTLSHSYVDLDDPEHLEFSYIRGIAAVIDVTLPDDRVRALHVGGGGLTLPRYLEATRSDASSLVMEIDRGVVELDEEQLAVKTGPDLEILVKDARVGLRSEGSATRDVVIGDAFSGLSVPWHLTTREALTEVRRVLDDDGLYVMNLIDYPPLGFVRAEAATIRDAFPYAALIARPETLRRRSGGNVLIVGSERALPLQALTDSLSERVPEFDLMSDPGDLDAFIDDASILNDDFAPVDQLLTPHGG